MYHHANKKDLEVTWNNDGKEKVFVPVPAQAMRNKQIRIKVSQASYMQIDA